MRIECNRRPRPLWITTLFSAFIIAIVFSKSLIRAEEKATAAATKDETTTQNQIEFPQEIPRLDSIQNALGEDYRIGIGDRLRAVAFKELDVTVLVRPDGKISLPVIGEVVAAGRSPMELSLSLSQLAKTKVVVMVEKIGAQKEEAVDETDVAVDVAIIGEVKRPGLYEVSSLYELIAKAGGFADGASKNRIQLIREGVAYSVDFDDYELEDDDFVVVGKSFVRKTRDFISWVAKPVRALLWLDGIL